MTTIRTLADQHDMQPYELAALLDLGRDYDETAELDPATESEYREVIAVAQETSGADRVQANVTAAMPALTATVEACERLLAVLDIPRSDMHGRSRALRRETAAVEAALRELEPHQDTLPYYYASIPGYAAQVLSAVPEAAKGERSPERARTMVRAMRGYIGQGS